METEQEQEQYQVIFEAPKIIPPELRLYYDDKGKVITYTCEKLEGDYIVIDAATFAAARPDVRIIDGKISTVAPNAVVSKLMPDTEGVECPEEDISIVASSNYKGKKTKWKMVTYELQ
jgi:hypothetical protein